MAEERRVRIEEKHKEHAKEETRNLFVYSFLYTVHQYSMPFYPFLLILIRLLTDTVRVACLLKIHTPVYGAISNYRSRNYIYRNHNTVSAEITLHTIPKNKTQNSLPPQYASNYHPPCFEASSIQSKYVIKRPFLIL